MRIINFGACNKNLIYPLLGGISKIVVNSILYMFEDKVELNKHSFILGINAGFGMSLAFIPYIYILKYSKIKKEENLKDNNSYIDNLFNKYSPIEKKQKYLIIFLCAFLDFLQRFLVYLFIYSITNNIWIFNIIFLNVFTYILTKNPIYKHQYFSSAIMILFGIGLNILNLYKMKKEDVPMLFLSLFIEIIYSLGIVLAKYGMDNLFCSPYEITFYEGIFALIINIIFLIITTNIPLGKNFKYTKLLKISEYNGEKYLDNFFKYINKINIIEVLLFIASMLGRVLSNLFSHITIKHFTSSHVILLLIIGEISLNWKDKSISEAVITAFIFIVELLMLLVFCEIIEINLCELKDNTKKNIEKRAEKAIFDESGETSTDINFVELEGDNNRYSVNSNLIEEE